MEIEKERLLKDAARGKDFGEYELWENLMLKTLFQIETLGFEAIVLIPGHYPLIRSVNNSVDKYFESGGKCHILKLTDFNYDADDGYSGDHAAAFETSLMMALHPELVDLSKLDDDLSKPNIGVIGRDPRIHASEEFGNKILDKFVDVTRGFINTTICIDNKI